MYMDLGEHLDELRRTLGADSGSYRTTETARLEHPNLRAYRDHLGIVRLCSCDVNQYVDNVDLVHRNDDEGSSLEVFPFLTDKGARIYADPPMFVVGYRNPKGFGEVPLHDWQTHLEDAKIPIEIIRKVRWYLGAHAPVNYDQIPD